VLGRERALPRMEEERRSRTVARFDDLIEPHRPALVRPRMVAQALDLYAVDVTLEHHFLALVEGERVMRGAQAAVVSEHDEHVAVPLDRFVDEMPMPWMELWHLKARGHNRD